jgi:hypothetical protein
VARRVSCDEAGQFRFNSLLKEVVAGPGTILSVKRFTFNWPYRRAVLVTTTTNRFYLSQKFERRSEVRAALLRANPQMKIAAGTLSQELLCSRAASDSRRALPDPHGWNPRVAAASRRMGMSVHRHEPLRHSSRRCDRRRSRSEPQLGSEIWLKRAVGEALVRSLRGGQGGRDPTRSARRQCHGRQ